MPQPDSMMIGLYRNRVLLSVSHASLLCSLNLEFRYEGPHLADAFRQLGADKVYVMLW